MKYKCCEHLLHQIVFDQDEIKPCCATSMNKEVAKFVENFDGLNFDVDNYLKNYCANDCKYYIVKKQTNNVK